MHKILIENTISYKITIPKYNIILGIVKDKRGIRHQKAYAKTNKIGRTRKKIESNNTGRCGLDNVTIMLAQTQLQQTKVE